MKILVLAVHPDDETLACGGTLLRHKNEGDEIHWLIGTQLKHEDGYNKETVKKREETIKKVAQAYQFNSVNQLGFSPTKVDQTATDSIISTISQIINSIKPQVVYLPFKSDVHSDHRILFQAMFSCLKTFRYPFIKKIYMMETLSETEFAPCTQENAFLPNVYVDISDTLNKKIEIMNLYETELGEHPFPRSTENIRALATFRGATSNIQYAEAFMLLKEIR